MHIELPCGRESVSVELPDRCHLLETKPADPLPDPHQAVLDALRNPIGTRPLREIAVGRKDACVVISDITRPVPNHILLPPLLQTLEESGIDRGNITILIATGMHRPNLGEELAGMVGREVMDNYTIVNHYCRRREELREVTRIDGAPIEINSLYLDSDLKILTGLIEPHFYAGFSGSRKSVLPGISSYETMKFMHSYRVIDRLREANCRLENNIFHEYAMAVCEQAGVDFICNVVINQERQAAGIFGGHYDEAHRAGCAMVRSHAVVELEEKVDLVVTSAGGYPLDATFYQVSKSLTSAMDILEPGGTIVVACGCEEGLGSEDFCTIMRSHETPEEFNRHHADPGNFVIDQWCAQNIYQALDHAGDVHIYSPGLKTGEIEGFRGRKVDDIQSTLDHLVQGHRRIAVIPDGPYVVGKVASRSS